MSVEQSDQAGALPHVRGTLATPGRVEGSWPDVVVPVPRSHARAAVLVLVGLVVAAVVVRALLARRFPTPWILVDELIYSELAKSLAEQGRFALWGTSAEGIGKVYPTLIAPAWLADSTATAYKIAKSVNAVLACLAAVPVYLWARRLVSPLWSLVAAVLTLLLPVFVYTGALMTENAALPAFMLAAFAIALALERPSVATQAFALAAVALAAGVRVQAVVLLGVLLLATAFKVALDFRAGAGRPRALVRPYAPMLGAVGVLAAGYAGLKLAQGAELTSGLGSYADVVEGGYAWGEAPRWILHHLAELTLAVGVVPVAAFVVLAGLALVHGLPSPAERAFIAVAASALILVVVQVAIFASRFSFRIEERNMIYLMPVLLLALVVWVGRELPRPPVLAGAAALGSAALVLAIPEAMILNQGILTDTFGLIPVRRLAEIVSGGLDEARWIVALGALNAALVFLVVPRRIAAVALPLGLAVYFGVVTNIVLGETTEYSRSLRHYVAGEPSWIDERVGSDERAAYLFGGQSDPFFEASGVWQLQFWNRSLSDTYNVGAPSPLPIGERSASLEAATGRVTSDSGDLEAVRHVVVNHELAVAGRAVDQVGANVLYRVEPPVRLRSRTGGVYGDGWMGADAVYDRFATPGNRPGTLVVSVSRPALAYPADRARVEVTIGPLAMGRDGTLQAARVSARRVATVVAPRVRNLQLPTPPPPFRVTVHVDPVFTPAEFGLPDTRELGGRPAFSFEPALPRRATR